MYHISGTGAEKCTWIRKSKAKRIIIDPGKLSMTAELDLLGFVLVQTKMISSKTTINHEHKSKISIIRLTIAGAQ